MLLVFKWPLLFMTLLLLVEMISRCSIPFVIEALLFRPNDDGGWLIGILIVLLVVGLLFRHNNWRYGQEINLRLRTMLVKTLYKKLMRMSSCYLKNFEISRVITHLTSDLNSL